MRRAVRWAVRSSAACPRMQQMQARLPLPPGMPQVSPEGQVLQCLMDPDGSRVASVACVTEHQGQLFIGNLAEDYVSVLDLAEAAAAAATQ